MFCRCVALSLTAALLWVANAKAAPFVFDPDGPGGVAPIANAAGFDPAPGNLLAVGAQTAIQTFLATGGGPNGPGPNTVQTPFFSYYQATIPTVLTAGGGAAVGLPAGVDLTVVVGLTERVSSVSALGAGGIATFELVEGGMVNYLEIYQGGTPANNLTGQGFNDGTLVLRASLNELQTVQASATGVLVQNLDQFIGDNYTDHDTLPISAGFTVLGDVTFVNPNYISGITPGSVINFNLSTSTVAPFVSVDPSSAFLLGTFLTAGGASPVTAGAGLPGVPGVGIGTVNGGSIAQGGGTDVQLQADAAIAFQVGVSPVIPEPATMAIFGLMAVSSGVYGAVRRQRPKVA